MDILNHYVHLVCLFAIGLVLSSCAATVTHIDSNPSGADVFVIPARRLDNDPTLEDHPGIEEYRAPSGRTPMYFKGAEKSYEIIAEKDGLRGKQRINPSATVKEKIMIFLR